MFTHTHHTHTHTAYIISGYYYYYYVVYYENYENNNFRFLSCSFAAASSRLASSRFVSFEMQKIFCTRSLTIIFVSAVLLTAVLGNGTLPKSNGTACYTFFFAAAAAQFLKFLIFSLFTCLLSMRTAHTPRNALGVSLAD